MITSLKKTYSSFPRTFWTVVGARFIDRVGGWLLYPFITLYVTSKFGVNMIDIGWVFTLLTATSIISITLGGAMTDRIGRKKIILFGLFASAFIAVPLGLTNSWMIFLLLIFMSGLLGNFAGPAYNAMLADILPEEKRAEGFSILYVSANLAVTIGPMLGGLLASYSFMWLFIFDCIFSSITAIILLIALPETKPQPKQGEQPEPIRTTLAGYFKVMKDKIFISLVFLLMLTMVVYLNMNTTLPVFLQRQFAITPQQFGYLLSLNAAMVVLFTFFITKITKRYHRMDMMVLGTLLYAIGFGMYGFTSTYIMFLVAMAIITIGEIISSPIYQAAAADFAPADMRGRYMAVLNWGFSISHAFGPLAAGYVMEKLNPNWVWWGGGIICILAAIGFGLLKRREDQAQNVDLPSTEKVVSET